MIAIVIPYFRLRFFDKTLKSLADQKNKDFKVYIGNDASQENPEDLIAEYSYRLKIVYRKFEQNIGSISLVNQWERCIDMVDNEEWIMILGDDDVLEETVVESWYTHYNIFCSKTNLVRFHSQLIDSKDRVISQIFTHPIWEPSTDSFFRKFNRETRSSLSEYIFRKAAYERHKFKNFELGWHSDDRAWLDFSEKKAIYSIPDSVIYIRFSQDSISGKENNLHQKRQASIQFYKSLIRESLSIFSGKQRIEILKKYTYLKKSSGTFKLKNWVYLSFYYVRYFQLKAFKQFLRNFVNHYS